MFYLDKAEKVLHEGRFANDGFNCWGATQFIVSKKQKLQWISREAMQRWLDQRTVVVKGRRQAGDIIVLYYTASWLPKGEKVLTHTAVYAGDDKYIHKRGMNTSELTDLKNVKKPYGYVNVYERRRMI